jgi:SNF family Na+-dependent transporter
MRPVHLRLPSIDKGVTAFLWALFFGLYIWLGGIAVGVHKGSAFLIALVAAFAIFLFVRIYGEDRPRRSEI